VSGELIGIYIAPAAAAPMVAVSEVEAVSGRGLVGDRYYLGHGRFSKPQQNGYVTLIEWETIEAVGRELDGELGPWEPRRNLVTRGVALNDLVGRLFGVGAARLRGLELCEPCLYLERTSQRSGMLASLVHRGGLRAEIETGGRIAVGDPVTAVSD
jgi:MOSC domain-containing protein YiiM